MSNSLKNNQPVFAQILRTEEASITAGFTLAEIVIFGRHILERFYGSDHHDKAAVWVNEWNELFDREWLGIQEASAMIMLEFCDALRGLGVESALIKKAIVGMTVATEKVVVDAEA